jgi:hypothetical protein
VVYPKSEAGSVQRFLEMVCIISERCDLEALSSLVAPDEKASPDPRCQRLSELKPEAFVRSGSIVRSRQ